jgi:hypothetical protein
MNVPQHIPMFDSSYGIDFIDSDSIMCFSQYVDSLDGNMLSSYKINSFKDFTVKSSSQKFIVKDTEAKWRALVDH